MKILVLNSGSSSIKFQLIEMPSATVLAKGMIERIGEGSSGVHYQTQREDFRERQSVSDHSQGLKVITSLLTDPEKGVLSNPEDLEAVGHRVVHGGSTFDRPVRVDAGVLAAIERHSSLAPLHNPANAMGIRTARAFFKQAVQIAVFDTAFHQTLPEKAYHYAIPKRMAKEHAIRVYGFHGSSHKFVTERAVEYLNIPAPKIISIHLGNGCSMTATIDGKSMDHSLGFGPSNGLIMGTRSGDIDQSVVFFLMDTFGYSSRHVNEMLQKKSGLLGLTGFSDMRDVQRGAEEGNKDCRLALDMSAYRIQKYIGSYAAAMNGLDAIIFTAGIGENSSRLRELVCSNMNYFGIELDRQKNVNSNPISGITEIQSKESRVKVLVIPTDEELEIARQCYSLLNG